MEQFVSGLRALYHADTPKPVQGNLSGLSGVNIIAIGKVCDELRESWGREVVDACNACERGDEFGRGVLSRQYDASIKFAMDHMASTRPVHKMTEPMAVADLEYGLALAKLMADWKIQVLTRKVNSGDFEKKCKLFCEAINAAVKTGKRPTGKVMGNRRKALRDWGPKVWDEVVKALRAQGKIETRELGGHTSYHLRCQD
jgi:hypothetical protein